MHRSNLNAPDCSAPQPASVPSVVESLEHRIFLASDLVVTGTPTATPSSVAPGGTLSVSYTLRNQGPTTAFASKTKIQIKQVGSTVERHFQLFDVQSLAPNTNRAESHSVSVPATLPAGNYVAFIILDNNSTAGQGSANEGNDDDTSVSFAIAAAPQYSDLVVSGTPTAAPSPVTVGAQLTVTYTLRNQGAVDAGTSTTKIQIKALGSATEITYYTFPVLGLGVNQSRSESHQFNLPSNLAPGNYVAYIILDNNSVAGQGTANGSNDDDASVGFRAEAPPQLSDLVVFGTPTAAPNPATAGGQLTVGYTLRNRGAANAAASTTKIQIKAAGSSTELDAESFGVLALTAGQDRSESHGITLPASLPAGNYVAYVILDNGSTAGQGDANEGNDDDASVAFNIAAAPQHSDLIVSGAVSATPDPVAPGGTLKVAYTLRNQGGGDAAASTTKIQIKQAGSTAEAHVETFPVAALAAGVSRDESHDVNLPAGLAPGNYTAYVILDNASTAGQGDPNEANDDDASDAFEVRSSLPVSVTVLAPNGGEVWQPGVAGEVTWSASGTSPQLDHFELAYSIDNGGTYANAIGAAPLSARSLDWTPPLVLSPSAQLRVRVQAVDSGGAVLVEDVSNGSFTLGTTSTSPGGFDYPVGHRGYASGAPVAMAEFPHPSDVTPETNGTYPASPVASPVREATPRPTSGWYNAQDVGAFYPEWGGVHAGEDWNLVGDDVGELVYATAAGTVVDVRGGTPATGWTIVIRHTLPSGEQVYSVYGHVTHDTGNEDGVVGLESAFDFQEGDVVDRGDVIARIADITAFEDHLHFEMRTGTSGYDPKRPAAYFDENGVRPTGAFRSSLSAANVAATYQQMQDDGVLDASDFIDAHRPEAGSEHVFGVDVSEFQGHVIWDNVRAAGQTFAFVRATQGKNDGSPLDVDDLLVENVQGAANAGLLVGVYHVAYPHLNPSAAGARAEAAHFVTTTAPYLTDGYLRPALDLERGSTLGPAALSGWVNEWMAEVTRLSGVAPMVYTYPDYAENHLAESTGVFDLWIADYGMPRTSVFDPSRTPRTGIWNGAWDFWQFSDTATVNGIAVAVDLNIFSGDRQELTDFTIRGDLDHAPVAGADSYTTDEDVVLQVAAPGVLGNDNDDDNDALTAVLVTSPSHGTLTLSPNGSFTYTPAPNYHGADGFTYKPNDGSADGNTVTVSITVNPVNDAPAAAPGPVTPTAGGDVTPGWGRYWFNVVYSDDVAVRKATIGSGDVQVTGPGGYSQPGALSNLVLADGRWTVTYSVPAPGGTWNGADNGSYTISMRAGEVADDAGLFVPAGPLRTLLVNIQDAADPTATLSAANITTAGAHHWFQVTYDDDMGVNGATIGNGDVVVTGPRGYSQPGTLSNRVLSGGKYVVTYRVPAPGGTWDVADNGVYTVAMTAGAVADTAGKYVPVGALGGFSVSFPDTTPPTATLTAAPAITSAGASSYRFTVTYSDNVGIAYGVIDSQDVLVTGPGGYSQPGVLSNVTSSGNTRVVTYRVSAPGGTWGAEDNGTYTVTLNPGQVRDDASNFAAAGTLGSFGVAIPQPLSATTAGTGGTSGPLRFSDIPVIIPGDTKSSDEARYLQNLLE